MQTIGTFLVSLNQSMPITLIVLAVVIYLAFKVHQIDHKLGNHITDTNKKIDKMSDRMDKMSDRFDKLSDRFDRQNDQFVSLYNLLLKDKK